jgi:MarR family transcriptional regulator, organic hydroperoxide resistance regulator
MKMNKSEISQSLLLENQICFPFYAASRLIVQAYAPLLEEMELTYPQYLVLLALWEKDSQSVKEIGERLYLDSGTLTLMMQKLVASGYIHRNRAPEDDRVVLNSLTEKGKNLKAKAASMRHGLICRTGMSPEEGKSLRNSVQDLLGRLAAMNAEDHKA